MIIKNINNIINCITNITCLFPILLSIDSNDYTTTSIVLFAGISSAISHLFESHKHNMNGFGMNTTYSYLLNRLDIIGVIATVVRCLYMINQKTTIYIFIINNMQWIYMFIFSLLLLIISEMDVGNKIYIPFHSAWHLSIFLILYKLLIII